MEDGKYELRMGANAYWGYTAEERINSIVGDGIVMTIKLGDTIKFSRFRSSSSRSTDDHTVTNADLGIDVTLAPGDDKGPTEWTPDKVGTFVLDCTPHPGGHGKFTIIVEPA